MLKGWVPMAGDVWSAKQIYLNEQNAIAAFCGKEENKHIIAGTFCNFPLLKISFGSLWKVL
jgi:hypothetical protein